MNLFQKRKKISFLSKAKMGSSLKIRSYSILSLKILNCLFALQLILSYTAPFVDPNTISVMPFFGLTYPMALVMNVVFILVWIFIRSKWLILSSVVVLLGIPLHLRVFSFGFTNDSIPKNANPIKIMSYNVRLFDIYNEDFSEALNTRNKIFDFLKKEDPDVLCIQEFYFQDAPTKFNTLDSICEFLSVDSFYEKCMLFPTHRQHYGIALFSKYPIINKGIVGEHQTGTEEMNYCIYADIVKKKDTIRVYNVHFESIKLESDEYSRITNSQSRNRSTKLKKVYSKLNSAFKIRANQSKIVRDHIKSSPYKAVICGDFNDTPMSYTYQMFNSFLTDAFRNTSSGFGVTYIGYLPAGRIDYIFHSDGLQSAKFKIQNEEFSDHHAISCLIY